MPNVKFYFLLSTIYVLLIFWLTKSWIKTVVYCYLPLSIYYVGQLYVFRVIQPEELNHPLYPDGRSLYFKFTPLIVLSIAMLISWLYRIFVENIKSNWLISILMLGVLCKEISAVNGGILPWWVQYGDMVDDLGRILWLWWVIDYFSKNSKKEINYFWNYLNSFLKIITLIGSILVIAQGIKGSGFGLVVEQSGILPYSGAGSDGGWLNRPIGIWTHANNAAFSIFSLLLAWYLVKLYRGIKVDFFNQKWLFFPIVAIVWLQSRSVFLSIIPIVCWFWYFYKKEIVLSFAKIKLGILSWAAGVTLMFLSAIVIVDRLWNSLTNFGLYSGWDTRAKLISVAFRIISHHFWWGVGINNFIPIAFREDMSQVMMAFPEAVHNGWILILAEQGIIGAFVWIVFLLVLLKKWWSSSLKINLKWYLVAILVSQSIVMIFQPFHDILSLGVIVSVLLLADAKNEEKKFI
jgi:hypothetical protein